MKLQTPQSGNPSGKLFNFQINYNKSCSGVVDPLYNGNIAETYWKTSNDNTMRRYAYSYDALNRITSGKFNGSGQTDRYTVEGITYDKNGNIEHLTRRGHLNSGATSFGVMDNLAYTYDTGNKLLKVTDSGNKTYGFKDGTNTNNDYTYDANGNLLTDANKGITGISYNHLNLPTQVSFGSNKIAYIYDASGTKLKKEVTQGSSVTATEYANGYIYENGQLQFFSHPEGYVSKGNNAFKYVYQYKDHLGNVRLSYANAGTTNAQQLEIIEENNYYPFGLQHSGYNNVVSSNANSVAQKFKYNGKELEESLGLNLYEMDLRQYDPAIARWASIDSVTHHSMSTYTAFDNNPVYFADPSGANSTAEWMKANGITQDDLITIYQAPSDEDSADDSSSGCPPGDPNCSRKEDGTIQNQFEMSVDTEDMVTPEMAALMITLVEADGPLPFGDGVAATVGLNILVAYAIAHGTVGIINDFNESILAAADANWVYAKQEKEINRIMTKEGGPPGFTYMLTVNQATTTFDVRGNPITLQAGEVWKYGETTKGTSRYSQSQLDAMVPGGVTMKPIFFGNTVQIKVQEKIMIYGHFLATGSLPPGNKIFR